MPDAQGPVVHIVGGFLGSGKTTAIARAARQLLAEGRRVGVITNDQGRYLVDTLFFRSQDVPAVEVTGGCFCCNYDDFEERLATLEAAARPDVVFAESVGSCADVVATVVNPLLELGRTAIRPPSFTVFADSRLLRQRLAGGDLPFSDDVVYIFDKQLEEAGQIIVNKADLLPEGEVEELLKSARGRFPGKSVTAQNSLEPDSVASWLASLESGKACGVKALESIDYARYGSGEARLAWLDREIEFSGPGAFDERSVRRILQALEQAIRDKGWGIGHLKFFLRTGRGESKVSYTTLRVDEVPGAPQAAFEGPLSILINARVEAPADDLERCVDEVIGRLSRDGQLAGRVSKSDHFHPGFPRPTHRLDGG